MHDKTNTKVFIASSWELREDRRAFRELILEQNNAWHDQGAFLQVIGWEHFLDAISPTRLQDEYNQAVRDCDIFVMLYHTKVGKFTREEFETALAQFRKTGKPLIYTYCKTTPVTKTLNPEDAQSLNDFEQRLRELGHFNTKYENTQGLLLHFLQQLYRLADNGTIGFAPLGGKLPANAEATKLNYIHLGDVLGPGATKAGGDTNSFFNTGTYINTGPNIRTDGGAYVSGDVNLSRGGFVGRDRKDDDSKESK